MNPNRLSPLIDISLFNKAIEKNHLILTANQRLANEIQQAWGQSILGTQAVWTSPRIMSLEHWQSHCWNELQDQNHQLVQGLTKLGETQSLYLWEQAIAQHEDQTNTAYANMAHNCHDLLQRWDLTSSDIQSSSNSVDKFRNWANSYQKLLDKSHQVTNATAWRLVREAFQSAVLPKESVIALYGFQSIPPLQQATLEAASDKIIDIASSKPSGECLKIACADAKKEMDSAAKWAAQELSKNPNQRIGILVPELNSAVQPTARIISEALAHYNCPTDVNISAGVTLNETPLIYAALGLLNLCNYKQPLEEWLRLLYAPYSFFAQLPVQFKVECELALRETHSYQLGFDKFIQIIRGVQAKHTDPDALETTLDPLYKLQSWLKQHASGHKTFYDWAVCFQTLTEHLQWPGNRALDSLERQQQKQWYKLLANYCELDSLGIDISRSSALLYLHQLAGKQIFHPQTGDAPLQILGLLEGSGLVFDQLWIMGLSSDHFPSAQSMDPILPAHFQRTHAMPHSLPERELQIASKLLSGYRGNAKQVIYSWPVKEGESDIDESPLIKAIKQTEINALIAKHDQIPSWLKQTYQCELVADTAPAFDHQFESIRGGSSILKNQSTCPFNAFAIHRLAASQIKEPEMGLSAMTRGIIVHEILYRLWGDWKNSKKLTELSTEALYQKVNQQIQDVLTEQAKKHPILLGLRFKELEHQRLFNLTKQWLEIEKNRAPFEVAAVEQKVAINFGDLNISLTIDRVDHVDNKTVLIDYKTGSVNAKDWEGDRPKDPQLPLYVLAYTEAVDGCAFAQIKSNNIKFSGLMDDPAIPDISLCSDWPEQVQQWQQTLHNLATEFTQGESTLRVYNNQAFNYQDYLIPLNRWNEQGDLSDADEATSTQ